MNFETMQFGARLISRSGLLALIEILETYRGNLLRILVYHRIGNPEENNGLLDPSLLSATPEQFEQQMAFLKKHYHLLSICDLLSAIEAHEPLPPKSVMVTFDDGYHDFIESAWPILERYQIPALMFLPTGFLSPENQLFWWDRLYQGIYRTSCARLSLPSAGDFPLHTSQQRCEAFMALKRRISCMDFYCGMQLVDQVLEALAVIPETRGILLNWSDARWLNERGCCLAAHTRSHPILSRIPIEDSRQEVCESFKDISREIGSLWPVLAYPSGKAQDCGNNDISVILREEGFQLGMTTIPGINVLPHINPLRLKRIGLSTRISMPEFRLILTGIYHLFCALEAGLHTDA